MLVLGGVIDLRCQEIIWLSQKLFETCWKQTRTALSKISLAHVQIFLNVYLIHFDSIVPFDPHIFTTSFPSLRTCYEHFEESGLQFQHTTRESEGVESSL